MNRKVSFGLLAGLCLCILMWQQKILIEESKSPVSILTDQDFDSIRHKLGMAEVQEQLKEMVDEMDVTQLASLVGQFIPLGSTLYQRAHRRARNESKELRIAAEYQIDLDYKLWKTNRLRSPLPRHHSL